MKGRQGEPTRQKWDLSAQCEIQDGDMCYEISHHTVGETDIHDYFIERVACGEFLNPTWTKIYFLSPLKT
jgi:hypothetical protein